MKLIAACLIVVATTTQTAREMNITDREVKQIQAAAREYASDAMVNIGTVMVGCNCEEGPACTEQVGGILYNPKESKTVSFSRIKGDWQLSRALTWELHKKKLDTKYEKRLLAASEQDKPEIACDYFLALAALEAEKPLCPGQLPPNVSRFGIQKYKCK
jgi:hypothetical protein